MSSGSMADAAISYAVAQVGKPYVFGSDGPDAFDCSGLVFAAYKHAGYNWHSVRPWTGTMINYGVGVSRAALAPGDLVFPDPGHVQIYIGNGQIVEAVEPGIPLRIHAVWGFWRARRLVPPGTPYNPNNAQNAGFTLNPISGITNAFSGLSSFASVLSDGSTWVRLAEGLAGASLIMIVLVKVIL